jgi:methionine-rich copper-binding protein CopC
MKFSRIRGLLPLLCFLAVLLAMSPASWAHAILLEAIPAKSGTVTGPDITVRLKFNSRIDGARSQISLVLPDKSVLQLTIEKQQAPEILASRVQALKPGSYRLRWQVLASDGHITRGEYSFDVQ